MPAPTASLRRLRALDGVRDATLFGETVHVLVSDTLSPQTLREDLSLSADADRRPRGRPLAAGSSAVERNGLWLCPRSTTGYPQYSGDGELDPVGQFGVQCHTGRWIQSA